MKLLNLHGLKNYLLFILVLTLISCSKEDEDAFNPVYLVDTQEIATITRTQLLGILSDGEILPPELSYLVRYDIKAIRITYQTITPQGEAILASGALIVPDTSDPMPMLSFQHGTITDEISAPSNFQSDFTDLASLFASTGFILIIPDYLGYGESQHIDHPYEHRASLATACRDMIRASYEYFKVVNSAQPSSKLFLTGYSEGGFATMATFKLLQEEHPNEFNISAVTVGAGAYNKTAFMDWVVTSTNDLQYINTFVWVLDVYNNIYPNLRRPYSHYFNEPWDATIENYGVFTPIESNPSLLFTPHFIDGIVNQTDTHFISAVADNDCYSWVPQAPLRMYHGTADMLVPYFNSQTAYEAMISLGATNVELITIEGGTHETAIIDYALGTFSFFQNILATQ